MNWNRWLYSLQDLNLAVSLKQIKYLLGLGFIWSWKMRTAEDCDILSRSCIPSCYTPIHTNTIALLCAELQVKRLDCISKTRILLTRSGCCKCVCWNLSILTHDKRTFQFIVLSRKLFQNSVSFKIQRHQLNVSAVYMYF